MKTWLQQYTYDISWCNLHSFKKLKSNPLPNTTLDTIRKSPNLGMSSTKTTIKWITQTLYVGRATQLPKQTWCMKPGSAENESNDAILMGQDVTCYCKPDFNDDILYLTTRVHNPTATERTWQSIEWVARLELSKNGRASKRGLNFPRIMVGLPRSKMHFNLLFDAAVCNITPAPMSHAVKKRHNLLWLHWLAARTPGACEGTTHPRKHKANMHHKRTYRLLAPVWASILIQCFNGYKSRKLRRRDPKFHQITTQAMRSTQTNIIGAISSSHWLQTL